MKRFVSILLLWGMFASQTVFAAVRGNKSMYVGGTVASISQKTKGKLYIGNTRLSFTMKHGVIWSIPFEEMTTLTYGHKVGRRVGAAIGWTLIAGPVGLVALFSKKKKHFLTIDFNNAPAVAKSERAQLRTNAAYIPKGDIAVFEINKHDYKMVVKTLQARTGLRVAMPLHSKWNKI